MDVIGQKINQVRPMTEEEIEITWGLDDFHGHKPPDCIELEDGNIIIPSRDAEGNGAGVFFGTDHEHSFMISSPD